MTEVAEKDTTEATDAEATANAEGTDAAETTPPAEDKGKAMAKRTPKTYKERLDGAFEKENIVHKAFCAMVERETGFAPDLNSVIAAFSLYNDWRASDADDYKAAKAAAEASKPAKTPKAAKQPKTAAEAEDEKSKLMARLAELDAIKAELLAKESGSEDSAETPDAAVESDATAETQSDETPF